MTNFKDLGMGGKLDTLNQKIARLEQEISGLRSDMKQILAILREQQKEKKSAGDISKD